MYRPHAQWVDWWDEEKERERERERKKERERLVGRLRCDMKKTLI